MKLYLSKFNQLLVASLSLAPSSNAISAVYWNAGVRPTPDISVCFVGSALTSRAARVTQVRNYIRNVENTVNIRFNYLGTCPSPTTQANGNDYHDGDIRILIPGVLFDGSGKDIFFEVINIPGKGCTEKSAPDPKNPGGSWSNPPNDLERLRPCRYNLKLGDDADAGGTPWLNHTLHEFGHALGLAHEHERNDVERDAAGNKICTENGYGGSIGFGLMTPYDKQSVMHYKFNSCGINGNYDHTGLSDWDRLGLHMLYPEDNRIAEYIGTIAVRTTDSVRLKSAWQARGANINVVARDFAWTINNVLVGTTPDLDIALPAGTHKFRYQYVGRLGSVRNYSYKGKILVLTPKKYNRLMATLVAVQLPLF
jgi:hypothetical protein